MTAPRDRWTGPLEYGRRNYIDPEQLAERRATRRFCVGTFVLAIVAGLASTFHGISDGAAILLGIASFAGLVVVAAVASEG